MNGISYFFFGQDCAVLQRREAGYPREQVPRLYMQSWKDRRGEGQLGRVPKLYVIPEAAPNAFATGRNPHHASVAVTEGLP